MNAFILKEAQPIHKIKDSGVKNIKLSLESE
jgi:hypothetical protein